MSEDIRENEDTGMTSVEITEDDSSVDTEEQEEVVQTRTNVRNDDSDPEELEQYSKKVQKRISKLTEKRRQATEEAEAALQYAKRVQQQNDEMKQRLAALDSGYRSEYEGRVTSQEAQAKRALTEAHEAGDYEKVADAQSALAQVAIEKERLRVQKAKAARQQEEEQAQQQQVQQQPQPQQQQNQRPDPKIEKWLSKNEWFGADKPMTAVAKAIHEQLVLEEDFDPTSDEYYAEIDTRMRSEMPTKFKATQRNAQVVTPASTNGRSLKSGRKKQVELTPSQVKVARSLGVPLDKYAAQMAKIESRRA